MDQSIFFEGKNPKNAAKATEVLPLLVKYAEGGETVTYGELGKAVGVHHRVVRHILGVIGDALKKFDANIPMIQLIVINKKHRIVGTAGLGWLEEPEQIAARSQNEKEELCRVAQEKVFEYRHWREILAKCHLAPLSLSPPLETLIEEAAVSIFNGGAEGEDHRVLKEYVKAYPACIGLKQRFTRCSTESTLPSGDEMGVFFESATEQVCVEVKGRKSCEADMLRGIFQCVKYRAVLEAQGLCRNDKKPPVIRIYLVLATGLSEDLERLAKLLKIPVKPNVAVPQNFVAPEKKTTSPLRSSLRPQAANTG